MFASEAKNYSQNKEAEIEQFNERQASPPSLKIDQIMPLIDSKVKETLKNAVRAEEIPKLKEQLRPEIMKEVE